ncbi:uncharacterized protein LOC141689374 [Apium graveolens]|uniref:uncharacterized protein LOC141689374 n=1 Tax=Apium graveolens TaxID=4045 RepID=UPI003D796B16
MVSSLLDTDGNWDVDLIKDVFDERDVNIILTIPLNKAAQGSWYWRQEKMGSYSVKSAYYLLQDLKPNQNTSPSSGFWKRLWNLKIPPKVKNFLWRASTNCLPTKDLLQQKRIPVNILCPICHDTSETILHCLVLCPFAEICWTRVHVQPIHGVFHSFCEWLLLLFEQLDKKEVHISVMVCWMLWKHRNELVWNQRSLEISKILESACSILNQWNSVQDKTYDRFMAYMNHNDGDEHWHTPMTNRVKINVDAAIFDDTNCCIHAFVARDHEGQLVEARSKCLRGRSCPDLAEALSTREALSWVKGNNHRYLIVCK